MHRHIALNLTLSYRLYKLCHIYSRVIEHDVFPVLSRNNVSGMIWKPSCHAADSLRSWRKIISKIGSFNVIV